MPSSSPNNLLSLSIIFRRALRQLFLIVTLLFALFTLLTILEVVRGTVNDVRGHFRNVLSGDRSHLLALAFQGNIEGLQMVLEHLGGTDRRVILNYEKEAPHFISRFGGDSFALNYADKNYGYIVLRYHWFHLMDFKILFALLCFFALLFVSFIFVYRKTTRSVMDGVIRPLATINGALSQSTGIIELSQLPAVNTDFEELHGLVSTLQDAALLIGENEARKKEIEILKAETELAAQVYHDIASPLVALNMATGYLKDVPEDTLNTIRGAVRRIQEICNGLSHPRKFLIGAGKPLAATLSDCVKEIVTEKRMSLRGKSPIEITTGEELNADLGVVADGSEFKRVLSNLLNNSIEAMERGEGKIHVSVTDLGKSTSITIEDNGCGIPEDKMKELGKRGVSFGKKHLAGAGQGLGIYHAKKCLALWGGSLAIHSTAGKGTATTLTLPKSYSTEPQRENRPATR